MTDKIERNLLKYAAGRAVFCPSCEAIMDWRRTTLASLYVTMPAQEEKLARSFTLCGQCWDKYRPAFDKAVADVSSEHPNYKIRTEIVDGREARFKGRH